MFHFYSVCPDHQLPNFLASLTNPKLHSLDCDVRKNPLEPWKDVQVPVEIDQALTEVTQHSFFAKLFISC